MRFSTALTTLALAASALAAPLTKRASSSAVSTVIKNSCGFPVWVTSIASVRRETKYIAPGGNWSENEYYDGHTGTSLQVTKSAGVDGRKPILNAAYTYESTSLYYTLSTVADFGYDFYGSTVKWYAAKDPAQATFWESAPKPFVTKAFLGSETDLVLELCA